MPKHLHKAFDIRESHEMKCFHNAVSFHNALLFANTSWKLFSFPSLALVFCRNVCNLSHKRAFRAISFRFDSFLLETHKMAVHLLFEMFLCVLDWKITVFAVCSPEEMFFSSNVECFDFPFSSCALISFCYFKKQFDTRRRLHRMFIHRERDSYACCTKQ